ncbi:MAG: galactose oxidase, partial [Actinobacteria bacterium]|nr:galactose oxidase [Actinomycetota bacterium]
MRTSTCSSELPPPEGAGLGRDTAAASCWEIKALRPDSVDGTYWLLTPAMTEPARFWCDMTTDGGGWVRIGSGREQWTTAYEGKGRPDYLWGETPTLTRAIQLPATTVDALIDGHRVDDLSDGVRVRRAENVAGTAWQDLRFTFADRDRWVWTMGAEHRVDTWSFDGASGSGGQTRNFGSDQGLRRVNATTQSDQSFNWGFAYGTQVSGTPGAESYLWSATAGQGSALPYAEVYLRPQLRSADLDFPAVPDSGTAPIALTQVPDSRALPNPWGVSGIAGSTSIEGNVEVQAFEQIGNVMYVGGNFRDVQRDSSGTGRVRQSFLAAFNATTGEYLPG